MLVEEGILTQVNELRRSDMLLRNMPLLRSALFIMHCNMLLTYRLYEAKRKIIKLLYNNFPFSSITEIVKYIINPVTSTRVATNGADEVAGSNLNFFSSMGIMEPLSVPHKIMPTSEKDTVMAR